MNPEGAEGKIGRREDPLKKMGEGGSVKNPGANL